MEYGALQYVECIGDDLHIKGMSSSFPKQLKLKPGETAVFSWIAYKSKAQRNAMNKKVMADPRMVNFDPNSMPFDMKRMLMGGFRTIVDK
jgi:alkaline phosphatase